MSGAYGKIGSREEFYQHFTGKPTGKRPSGRSRLTWDGNITIYLRKIAVKSTNCINLVQNRYHWGVLVNSALNLRIP